MCYTATAATMCTLAQTNRIPCYYQEKEYKGSCSEPKHEVQTKTSLRDETVHTEPSIGDPLPGSQAKTGKQAHKPGIGEIGIYEFFIH